MTRAKFLRKFSPNASSIFSFCVEFFTYSDIRQLVQKVVIGEKCAIDFIGFFH